MRVRWTAAMVGLLAAPLGLVVGCGEGGSSGGSSGPKGLAVDVATLPALGPYVPGLDKEIPGLDEDRLKVAPPKGWVIPPRKGQVVVWFKESAANDYPQIAVTAEDFDAVMNVTRETAAEFAKALSAEFRRKDPDTKTRATPIHIGDFHGASYRRYARVTSDFRVVELERLVVETVVEGRKYAFEVRAYPGEVQKYADALYAVARGAKFLKRGAGEAPKPAEKPEEKPEAKPAEKPDVKPEEKPEAKPAEKPDVKPEEKPQPKPEEKPKPAEKPKPKKKKSGEFEIDDKEEIK